MNERVRVPILRRLALVLSYGACALGSAGACGSERDFQQPNDGGTGGENTGKGAGSSQSGTTHSAGWSGTGTTGAGRGGAGGSDAGGGARSQAGESSNGEGGSGGDAATARDAGYGGLGASGAGGSSALAGAGGEAESGGSSNGGTSGSGGAGPAVCGNGIVEANEGCDEGQDNALELLACAPDCSRIIVPKHIVISNVRNEEDLGPDPVATADAHCPAGYKAMFPYGSARRATTTPFQSRNSVDWVLQPYTYYVNAYENLVWLTREVPLLGVENGMFTSLVNPISTVVDCFVTNMNTDGTTLNTNNCQGWSSMNGMATTQCGIPYYTSQEFVASDVGVTCDGRCCISFYCVEQ